jgi:D-3-phosphoglycerate dehydrogenase
MKALVTAEVNTDIIKELEKLIDITYEGWEKEYRVLTEEEMISYSRDKDIVITSYDPITKKVINQCPNLKLIVCTRSNPVNIDIQYAREKNIKISYAPGRNADCTAEFTVALMLAVTRKIPMAYKALKDGKYVRLKGKQQTVQPGLRRDVTWDLNDKSPYVLFKGVQLKGKTVGIIGYGSIGRRVADICGAFGMNVLVNDPFVKNTDGITSVTFVSKRRMKYVSVSSNGVK